MSSKKVSIYGVPDWALGCLHYQLYKSLNRHYDVYLRDWTKAEQVAEFCGGEYDVIIGEANIMEMGSDVDKRKYIPVFHHNTLSLKNHGHFDHDYSESIKNFDTVYAISDQVASEVKERYGVECQVLPFGVSSKFFTERKLRPINNIGHVRAPNHDERYYRIKGLDKFRSICDITGLDEVILFGKNFHLGSAIYSDADMVVCTSESEGHPLPLLECAAAKIPFISTNVGIVSQFGSVKTFDTAEEAAEIISELRSDMDVLRKYVDEVHEEVMSSREIDKVVDTHWVPTINRIVE